MSYLRGSATWAVSLRYRDFRFLSGAMFLHYMCSGMEHVALGWLVLDMTDSPLMVGVSFAARSAPQLLLGVLSGTTADRVDRSMFLRFVTLGGIALAGMTALLILTDVIRSWHVIALAFGTGCLWTFYQASSKALVFDLVGPAHALNGLSLSAVGARIGGVIGAIVAGAIISTAGLGVQYIAVSIVYIVEFAVFFYIRHVGQPAGLQREPILQNVVGYFRLVRRNRTLLILMLLTANTEILGFTHSTLLPVFSRDVLHVGALGLGVMGAVREAGGVLGLMFIASLGDFRRKGLLLLLVETVAGLALMAIFLASNIFLFLVVLTLVNACTWAHNPLSQMLMLTSVSNKERGRAMGSWVLSLGLSPVGHVSLGGVAGILGAPGALLISGSVLAFSGVSAAIGLPRIRRLV